jgi:hypothetical protein
MVPKLWSVAGLACELGMDRRTLVRRLENVTPAETSERANGAIVRRFRMRDVITVLFRGGDDDSNLSPTEKRAFWQAREAQVRVIERERELVPGEHFRDALSSSLEVVSATLEGLPDVLERDCGIDAEAVARAQQVSDCLREEIYQKLINLEVPPS